MVVTSVRLRTTRDNNESAQILQPTAAATAKVFGETGEHVPHHVGLVCASVRSLPELTATTSRVMIT